MCSLFQSHRTRIFCAFAVLLVCNIILAAETKIPQQVVDLQKAATECIKSDDVVGALEKYQAVIQEFGGTKHALDAQRCIITTHINSDSLSTAQTELANMLSTYKSLDEDIDDALNHVIIAYNRKGHYQQTIEKCQYLLKQWPNSNRAMWGVSRQVQAQIMLGNITEAETLISTLKNDYSEEKYFGAVLCNDIAGSYIAKDFSDKAVALWQTVSQEFPEEPISKKKLASHYLKQGDLANAGSYIDQLKQNCDKKVACEGFYWLASTYKKDHPEYCADLYRQMVSTWPQENRSAEAQKRIVTLQIRLGDMTAADTELQRFLTLYGETQNAVSLLREIKGCYWSSGQRSKAQQLCAEMLRRYPDDPKAIYNQADWICGAFSIGDMSTAEAEIETFLAKYSKPEDVFLSQTARIQGECLYRNDYSLAIEVGSRALSNNPTHENAIGVHQNLARAYLEMDAKEQADAETATILQTFPEHPNLARVLNGIGNAYRKAKYYTKAVELFQVALNHADDNKNLQLEAYASMAKAKARDKGATNSADVEVLVQRLMADFNEAKRLGYHVFQIAEEYYFRAEEARKESGIEHARADYQKSVEIWQQNIHQIDDPYHQAMAAFYSGAAYAYLKDYANAAELMRMTAEQWPDSEYTEQALSLRTGYLRRLQGQGQLTSSEIRSQLEETYIKMLETDSESETAQEITYKLAELKFRKEQWQDAITYFTQYVINNPKEKKAISAIYMMANAYEATGDNAKAKELYTRYLKLAPTDYFADEAREKLERL